mmetsp:Transcript_39038/g.83312  ORF Transcript_39038/g.83312 Transcript_39038/m.83312 type:complete len:219 (-) Transcript_39038:358-1014(-)
MSTPRRKVPVVSTTVVDSISTRSFVSASMATTPRMRALRWFAFAFADDRALAFSSRSCSFLVPPPAGASSSPTSAGSANGANASIPSPSSSSRSSADASYISKLSSVPSSFFSNNLCMFSLYRSRSIWALGPLTAGPFLRFSTRKCIPLSSATAPMTPPSASISRTRCPFPIPPMEGLHDSSPRVDASCVTSNVRAPVRAAAVAASVPACPPPTTTTS